MAMTTRACVRVAALVAVAMAATVGSAGADSGDQEYLRLVRVNGVSAGQDDALILFARQVCFEPKAPAGWDLINQGVPYNSLNTLRIAANRTLCPDVIGNLPPQMALFPPMSPYPYGM